MNDGINERVSKTNLFLLLLIGFSTIFISVCLVYISHELTSDERKAEQISFVGVYKTDDMECYKAINEEMRIDANKKNHIVFVGHFNQNINENHRVFLRIPYLSVKIKVNGKYVFECNNDYYKAPITKWIGNSWCSFYAPKILSSDMVEIEVTNMYLGNGKNAYNKFLGGMYMGDEKELLRVMIKKNIFSVTCAILLFLGAAMLLSITMIMGRKIKHHKSVAYCAVYILNSCILILLNHEYISLFVFHNCVALVFETITYVLLVPLLCGYLGCFLDGPVAIAMKWLQNICTAFGFICIICMSLGLPIIMVLQNVSRNIWIIVSGIGIVSIAVSIFLKPNMEKVMILISFCALSIGEIIELINVKYSICQRGKALSIGLLVLLFVQLMASVQYVIKGIDESNKEIKNENDLLVAKIKIMRSQIQPHFLFNSLSAIAGLCDIDAGKSRNSIVVFSQYLRENLNSLIKTGPIPFERELEHVKNYFYLEKIRFGEQISITYDIKAMDFVIPPITIQPIAENAIKHGILPKNCGGNVLISTCEDEKNIIITVADDGVGFDGKSLDNPQSGLSTIKKRLLAQMNGTLEIFGEMNKGTTVKIQLPKERNETIENTSNR